MAKFMKDGGRTRTSGDVDCVKELAIKDLLEVYVSNRSSQLSDRHLYLGPKVEKYLAELGLSRDPAPSCLPGWTRSGLSTVRPCPRH